MDELLKWRGEFPILDRTTYLISNSLGAMPRAVYDTLRNYADSWAGRGVRAWEEGWWDMAVGVGDKIAPLIGAAPGEISLHQNVTLTQAVISSCFDFRGPRNKVVMTDFEFPSIQYFYHGNSATARAWSWFQVSDTVRFDLDRFLAAIDETTLLVPISLVLFRSSYIVDARAIIERAHRVGAHVILDVFQATGAIPVDVHTLGADFAVGGVLKWLCGGPGVAYLYVRDDLRAKLNPALTGWIAHRRPFAFEDGQHRRARRFLPLSQRHAAHPRALRLPTGPGHHQQGRHRGHSRQIHHHDHALTRRRAGTRLARQYAR